MPGQNLIYREECHKIVGACFEVYNDKGSGFHEGVYQQCLEIELELHGIPFVSKPTLKPTYKNRKLQEGYIPDLVVYDKIIVGLKALTKLAPEHDAQVLNYLKATGFELGLLANFGRNPNLEWKRIVKTTKPFSPPNLLS